MARRLDEYDKLVRAVGITLPDGRKFKNGVLISAGDAARSAGTRARDAAFDLQGGEYATRGGPNPNDAGRAAYADYLGLGGEGPALAQPSSPAPYRPARTLAGGAGGGVTATVVPLGGAPDANAFQGALATLRNAGPVEGKDYSEATLQRIARQPGGMERIVIEADTVLPVVQQRRQLDQSQSYVGTLAKQSEGLSVQIAEVEKTIEPAPTLDLSNPEAQQRVMAQAQVLAEAQGSNDPKAFFDQARQSIEFNDKIAWEGRNKDALALRRQLQQNQKDVQAQVTDFAKRGIFAAPAAAQDAAVDPAIAAITAANPELAGDGATPPNQSGMSRTDERAFIANEVLRMNGLREERRQRRLDAIDPRAPGAAEQLQAILGEAESAGAFRPVNNPLPAGSIGYTRPGGTYTVELADGSARDFANANAAATSFSQEAQIYGDELAADTAGIALNDSIAMAPPLVDGAPRRNLAMANQVTDAEMEAARNYAAAAIADEDMLPMTAPTQAPTPSVASPTRLLDPANPPAWYQSQFRNRRTGQVETSFDLNAAIANPIKNAWNAYGRAVDGAMEQNRRRRLDGLQQD